MHLLASFVLQSAPAQLSILCICTCLHGMHFYACQLKVMIIQSYRLFLQMYVIVCILFQFRLGRPGSLDPLYKPNSNPKLTKYIAYPPIHYYAYDISR
jgi:hypothetical protein